MQKHIAQAALTFLSRTQLQAQEVDAFLSVRQELQRHAYPEAVATEGDGELAADGQEAGDGAAAKGEQ